MGWFDASPKPGVAPFRYEADQSPAFDPFLALSKRVQCGIDELVHEAGGPVHMGGLADQVIQLDETHLYARSVPVIWRVVGADGEWLGQVECDAIACTVVVRSPFREAAERGVLL